MPACKSAWQSVLGACKRRYDAWGLQVSSLTLGTGCLVLATCSLQGGAWHLALVLAACTLALASAGLQVASVCLGLASWCLQVLAWDLRVASCGLALASAGLAVPSACSGASAWCLGVSSLVLASTGLQVRSQCSGLGVWQCCLVLDSGDVRVGSGWCNPRTSTWYSQPGTPKHHTRVALEHPSPPPWCLACRGHSCRDVGGTSRSGIKFTWP
jgi:hypothetical protein